MCIRDSYYGVQLAALSWMRGTMGDLVPLLEQMVIDAPELPTIRAALALACAEADRSADTRSALAAFAARGYELPQDSAWLAGMNEYALAAIALADPEFAGPIFEQLAPYPEQFATAGGITAEGPVATVLGGLATVLGHFGDADQYFAGADDWCARTDTAFFQAHNNLLWAGLLAARDARGDSERARELSARALALAGAGGYAGIANGAAALRS